MDYSDLKRILGKSSADRIEDAVLLALAEARTPEATAALSRLLACLTAAVAYRAKTGPIADQCTTDFANAMQTLRAS